MSTRAVLRANTRTAYETLVRLCYLVLQPFRPQHTLPTVRELPTVNYHQYRSCLWAI